MILVDKVTFNQPDDQYPEMARDTTIGVEMSIISKEGNRYSARPFLHVKGSVVYAYPDTVMAQSLILNFALKDPAQGLLDIGVRETTSILDFVTLKAYEFPFINILWIGILVMVIGIAMSIVYRIKLLKGKESNKPLG